jgi:hypothetical protein
MTPLGERAAGGKLEWSFIKQRTEIVSASTDIVSVCWTGQGAEGKQDTESLTAKDAKKGRKGRESSDVAAKLRPRTGDTISRRIAYNSASVSPPIEETLFA